MNILIPEVIYFVPIFPPLLTEGHMYLYQLMMILMGQSGLYCTLVNFVQN